MMPHSSWNCLWNVWQLPGSCSKIQEQDNYTSVSTGVFKLCIIFFCRLNLQTNNMFAESYYHIIWERYSHPGWEIWCWRNAARRGEAGWSGEGLQALFGLHTYLSVGWIRRQQNVVARYDDVAETLIELGTIDGQVVVLEPRATFGQRQTDVLILVFW